MEKFNEATRVQMPAMVHLMRLGYQYYGKLHEEKAGLLYDPETNILIEVFKSQFAKLNPQRANEWEQALKDIRKELNDDDLGRGFYHHLKAISPTRLIDFDNPKNNTFHFTAEFTCKNGDDEFRPDITLFINGLPLCFVEVKKPNNQGGMVAESRRMTKERFPNKKFRRFINAAQLMIFSNNMEYDTLGGVVPVQGAFYCTGAKEKTVFNCFREENPLGQKEAPYHTSYRYYPIDPKIEKQILTDYNCTVIHTSPEYQSNLSEYTPTNRILTSMCSPERLLYILKYGIAFVKSQREIDGKMVEKEEKHIMRYQQLFAAQAIEKKLSEGITSGLVWHTQGSGKTALSYHLTYVLNDYFTRQNKVAKFYFIVDRIDLLDQATQEFKARGLVVTTANSRKELMAQFRNNQSQEGHSGKAEITVVNIQRFEHDKEKVDLSGYATNLQRVFILDEAHRGYRPEGCFLANLFDADRNAIKIALTGTPLLKEESASLKVFGNYLHTYYYDRSIADGYTLKIIREDIETSYKEKLTEVQEKLETLVSQKDVKKGDIIEHDNYVDELLRYVITDLIKFRKIQGDATLGGMIICETSGQAEKFYAHFDQIQQQLYGEKKLRAGLILHDYEDKDTRKQIVKDFKDNMTIDILIVFNMLLTGFDAPRLKRLYFGRKLKDHNLLQAITRVNRPYKDMRYGFIIDFADIKRNFDETNEAYLQELNRFNNPENTDKDNITPFIQVLENKDEIIEQMKEIRQVLFDYSFDNAEDFSTEISTLEDKAVLLELKHALEAAKDMGNLVRTFGDEQLREAFAKVELTKLPALLSEVQHRINMINQKEAFTVNHQTKLLINEAMLDIEFNFAKIGEEELKLIAGGIELKEKWRRTITSFTENIDQDDPEFITLREAFEKRCKEHHFVVNSIAKFNEEAKAMDDIIKRLQNLQRHNNTLLKKYNGDAKFARVHKRIREENKQRETEGKSPMFTFRDEEIMTILNIIKSNIDEKVYDRNDILKKDAYFSKTVTFLISDTLYQFPQITPEKEDYNFITQKIAQQYINQYNTTYNS